MTSVTSFTAARMQQIEDQAIVGGHITGDNLILERNSGATVNAGSVRGPQGVAGPSGSVSGSLGANDNRILRTDGTGGTLAQGSGAILGDDGRITAPLMTVTNAPSVGDDVVNKLYADKAGRGLLGSTSYTTQEGLVLDNWKTLSGLAITFTPVVGRYYRFTSQVTFIGPAAGVACALAVFRSTDPGNPVARADIATANVWHNTATVSRIITIPSGWDVATQFIIRARVNGYVDTGSDAIPATFTIEDVGAP